MLDPFCSFQLLSWAIALGGLHPAVETMRRHAVSGNIALLDNHWITMMRRLAVLPAGPCAVHLEMQRLANRPRLRLHCIAPASQNGFQVTWPRIPWRLVVVNVGLSGSSNPVDNSRKHGPVKVIPQHISPLSVAMDHSVRLEHSQSFLALVVEKTRITVVNHTLNPSSRPAQDDHLAINSPWYQYRSVAERFQDRRGPDILVVSSS